jgi:hypothetical protein
MSNIFKKLGIGIADFGKWFAGAAQETANLSVKIQKVLSSVQPLEAPFVTGLASVVSDVEALLAASTAAVSADGLNLPADSQAYQQFLTLVADFRKLVPVATAAIRTLEGKTAPPATVVVPIAK